MNRAYSVCTPSAAESHVVVESAAKLRHVHQWQPETAPVSPLNAMKSAQDF